MKNPDKKQIISLADMQVEQIGVISCLSGGKNFQDRLNALNIRCGKRIKKISASPFQGPIVIEIEHSRVALGYGMAGKIMVEI